MIIPSRRRFLIGAAALLAAPAIAEASNLMPISVLKPPKLWGDGIHDDTDALQWRADHAKLYDHEVVPPGSYLVSKTISYRGIEGLRIANCEFIGKTPLDCVIHIDNCRNGWIQNITFRNSNFIVGPDRKWLWLPPGDPAPAPPTV